MDILPSLKICFSIWNERDNSESCENIKGPDIMIGEINIPLSSIKIDGERFFRSYTLLPTGIVIF